MRIKHPCDPIGLNEWTCHACELNFRFPYASTKGHIWNYTLWDYKERLLPEMKAKTAARMQETLKKSFNVH